MEQQLPDCTTAQSVRDVQDPGAPQLPADSSGIAGLQRHVRGMVVVGGQHLHMAVPSSSHTMRQSSLNCSRSLEDWASSSGMNASSHLQPVSGVVHDIQLAVSQQVGGV